VNEHNKKEAGEHLLDDIYSNLQELLKIQEAKLSGGPGSESGNSTQIVDFLREIVFLLNADSRILYVNRTVEEELGYPVGDIPGNDFFRFVHPEDIERYRIPALRDWTRSQDAVRIRRIRLESHAGEWIPFEASGRVIENEEQNVVVLSLRRLQLPDPPVQSHPVTSPDAATGYHFSRIVKNYRTQLAVIQKALKMLQADQYHEEQRYYLQMIKSAVDRGWQELKKLLNYMDPGEPNIQILPAEQLMGNFKEVLAPLLPADYTIKTENNIDDDFVKADPDQMQRVFSILSSNAIEAMPHGGKITLGIDYEPKMKSDRKESRDTPSHIRFLVSDTGSGIPTTLQPFVFFPYITTKTNQAVSGMGLAIARTIVQLHDGWMEIAHSSRTGTTMIFTLPRARHSEADSRYFREQMQDSGHRQDAGSVKDFDYLHDLIDSVTERKRQSGR